jgi:hypothetical protein
MSDRLSLSQVAALMAYAATTAGGKTPALRGAGDGPLAERIAGFLLNGYFFVALILYARLTVLWVWILSFTPALARLSVPRACIRAHASAWLPRFCRTVAIRLVIDIVLIWCGLFFIAG